MQTNKNWTLWCFVFFSWPLLCLCVLYESCRWLPEAKSLGVTIKGGYNVEIISVACKFSHPFLSETLCCFYTSDGGHGLSFPSSQICLWDCWGQWKLCVDLLLLSRNKWAVMKVYESALEGVGVTTAADVITYLLLHHPLLCHRLRDWSLSI